MVGRGLSKGKMDGGEEDFAKPWRRPQTLGWREATSMGNLLGALQIPPTIYSCVYYRSIDPYVQSLDFLCMIVTLTRWVGNVRDACNSMNLRR